MRGAVTAVAAAQAAAACGRPPRRGWLGRAPRSARAASCRAATGAAARPARPDRAWAITPTRGGCASSRAHAARPLSAGLAAVASGKRRSRWPTRGHGRAASSIATAGSSAWLHRSASCALSRARRHSRAPSVACALGDRRKPGRSGRRDRQRDRALRPGARRAAGHGWPDRGPGLPDGRGHLRRGRGAALERESLADRSPGCPGSRARSRRDLAGPGSRSARPAR